MKCVRDSVFYVSVNMFSGCVFCVCGVIFL